MRGNLADLAATGIASEPTLRKWIAAEPDQSWIIKRGSNGDAYEIEIEQAVLAFQAGEDAKLQAARERSGAIRQIAMDLGLGQREDDPSSVELSIAERRQLLEEEFAANKLARLRDELVPFAEACAAFGDVLVRQQQLARTFAARLAKKIDLTREQIAAIERMVEGDLVTISRWMEKMEVTSGNGGTVRIGPTSTAQVADTAV